MGKSYWSHQLGQEVVHDEITIFEQDNEPTFTGLLDAQGREIYKQTGRQQIGFIDQPKPRYRVKAQSRQWNSR